MHHWESVNWSFFESCVTISPHIKSSETCRKGVPKLKNCAWKMRISVKYCFSDHKVWKFKENPTKDFVWNGVYIVNSKYEFNILKNPNWIKQQGAHTFFMIRSASMKLYDCSETLSTNLIIIKKQIKIKFYSFYYVIS